MTEVRLPEEGDLFWINLDPRTGHEQSGHRPCLILSSSQFTSRTGIAIICPVTSKVKGLPYEVPVRAGEINGVILSFHIRSVDFKTRNPKYITQAPDLVLQEVRSMLSVFLGL